MRIWQMRVGGWLVGQSDVLSLSTGAVLGLLWRLTLDLDGLHSNLFCFSVALVNGWLIGLLLWMPLLVWFSTVLDHVSRVRSLGLEGFCLEWVLLVLGLRGPPARHAAHGDESAGARTVRSEAAA
ncbi:unnamed protein product, partial [Prorocentrum cordatum]